MNLSQVTQPRSSRFLVWNKNNSFLTHIPPSHNAVSKKCHPLTTAFDRLLSFSPGSLALPSGPSRWSMWVARGAVSVVSASSSSHSLVQDKPVCPVKLAFLVEGSHFRVVKKKKFTSPTSGDSLSVKSSWQADPGRHFGTLDYTSSGPRFLTS